VLCLSAIEQGHVMRIPIAPVIFVALLAIVVVAFMHV
jgi:hypothetical protein